MEVSYQYFGDTQQPKPTLAMTPRLTPSFGSPPHADVFPSLHHALLDDLRALRRVSVDASETAQLIPPTPHTHASNHSNTTNALRMGEVDMCDSSVNAVLTLLKSRVRQQLRQLCLSSSAGCVETLKERNEITSVRLQSAWLVWEKASEGSGVDLKWLDSVITHVVILLQEWEEKSNKETGVWQLKTEEVSAVSAVHIPWTSEVGFTAFERLVNGAKWQERLTAILVKNSSLGFAISGVAVAVSVAFLVADIYECLRLTSPHGKSVKIGLDLLHLFAAVLTSLFLYILHHSPQSTPMTQRGRIALGSSKPEVFSKDTFYPNEGVLSSEWESGPDSPAPFDGQVETKGRSDGEHVRLRVVKDTQKALPNFSSPVGNQVHSSLLCFSQKSSEYLSAPCQSHSAQQSNNTPLDVIQVHPNEDKTSKKTEIRADAEYNYGVISSCAEAERKVPKLCPDLLSGVGAPVEAQQRHHFIHRGDRATMLCRYFADNVQKSVCPLVVVEYNASHATTPSNHLIAAAEGPNCTIVYSNTPATDTLRRCLLTDPSGMEMSSVFTIYQCRKRPVKKGATTNNPTVNHFEEQNSNHPTPTRTTTPTTAATPNLIHIQRSLTMDTSSTAPMIMAASEAYSRTLPSYQGDLKGTTLPALPHARSPSALCLVPAPPPGKQKSEKKKKYFMDEITDPQCLFETGVEDFLTLAAVQNGVWFNVFAMSADSVTLPPSILDVRRGVEANDQPAARNMSKVRTTSPKRATNKSYLILLFLQEMETDELEQRFKFPMMRKTGPSCLQSSILTRASTAGPNPSVYGNTRKQSKRASIASATNFVMESNLLTGERGSLEDTTSGGDAHPPQSQNTTATPPTRQSMRPSQNTECKPVSTERGHFVDHVTAEQLKERLASLAAVREVELTARVPESFLFNFIALMIMLTKVLKRYKSVNCRVDAENMYLSLQVEANVGLELGEPLENTTSLTAAENTTSDGFDARETDTSSEMLASVLSPSLLEYLRVCDASLIFNDTGCVLYFPYTTKERLDMMRDTGTVQLSTVKTLSLFGVAGANAITEEAVAKNGELLPKVQFLPYSSAEDAFTEAVRKSKPSPPLRGEDAEKNSGSPLFLDCPVEELRGGNVSIFGLHAQVDEAASSLGSLCALPMVLGGQMQRSFEAAALAAAAARVVNSSPSLTAATAAAAAAVVVTQSGIDGFSALASGEPLALAEPILEETESKSGSDNVHVAQDSPRQRDISGSDKPRLRSSSDQMATSISCNGYFNVQHIPGLGRYKRHLHMFLFLKESRNDVVQNLWSEGHSAILVTDPAVMKRYLLVGMDAFDVMFVEWTDKLVSQSLRDLIVSNNGKRVVTFFILKENAYTLPLPTGTPDAAVLRIHDIKEIFTDPSLLHSMSQYIRQHQLFHEMVQIRWQKSYQIVRQIGVGSFGDVYEVYIFVSRGRLAMKRLIINGASQRVLEQIHREVLIMSQLDHPNVVSFSHSSMEENAYCIFMELCDATLAQRLQGSNPSNSANDEKQEHEKGQPRQQRQKQPHHQPSTSLPNPKLPVSRLSTVGMFPRHSLSGSPTPLTSEGTSKPFGSLTPREAVLLLRDIAGGLSYIHSQGIVHRDIKPCNILFVNGVAKIADFGSAAEEREARPLTNMKGTLAYMSPEVLLGEPYGKPCDMWSFGCLIAEVIGVRLGHLRGLHVPALMDLYGSIPPDGSLPVTLANYQVASFQNHYGESTASQILEAMKSAILESSTERMRESSSAPSRRPWASTSHREKSHTALRASAASGCGGGSGGSGGAPTNSGGVVVFATPIVEHEETVDARLCSGSGECSRPVAFISTNSTSFLGSEKAYLPESLLELMEGLFRRDPRKRMTAEEVLDHPVTWNVEWMEMVMRAVEEACPREALERADATLGAEVAPKERNLDLSIASDC